MNELEMAAAADEVSTVRLGVRDSLVVVVQPNTSTAEMKVLLMEARRRHPDAMSVEVERATHPF